LGRTSRVARSRETAPSRSEILGVRGVLGEDRVQERAGRLPVALPLLAKAQLHQDLGPGELRAPVVGFELQGPLDRLERARQVVQAHAIGGEHPVDLGIVGTRLGGLLHQLVGQHRVSRRAVQAGEQVDDVDGFLLGLDGPLEHRDGLVPALHPQQPGGELLVGHRPLLQLGDLEGLAQQALRALLVGTAYRAGHHRVVLVSGERLDEILVGSHALFLPIQPRQREGHRPQALLVLGIRRDRRLVGLQPLLPAVQRREHLAPYQVCLRIARIRLDDRREQLEGLFPLASQDRQLAELDLRVDVGGIQTDRLAQLPEAFARLLCAEIGLRKLVVGAAVIRVDLEHALELDDRFPKAPLLHIGLAPLEVLLELDRVVLTGDERSQQHEENTDAGMTHEGTSRRSDDSRWTPAARPRFPRAQRFQRSSRRIKGCRPNRWTPRSRDCGASCDA
jgi:hypothetical protein